MRRMAMMLAILPFWTVSGCATSAPSPAQLPSTPPAPAPAPVIAGGWNQVDPQGADVQADASFAATQLPGDAPMPAAVEQARQQVVAGTNVELVLRLRDGSRWQVVVWRKLDGTREMTSAVRLDH